ncbi:MAG: hypothetical protein IJR90_03540 [Clostridia bacterium]|nr:hypothetical protein [Clostridia bacterium]
MLNEIEEFIAYTTFPEYEIKNKRDTAYLGRFTFDMLKKFDGRTRVFTILARGYMWQTDKPDVDRAERALKAWCSLPASKQPKKRTPGQDRVSFPELHGEIPELVGEDGAGWFHNHVHNVVDTVLDNTDKVYPTTIDSADILAHGFDAAWCDRVMQYQASMYSRKTKGWVRRFTDIIAEAKEEGPLKNKDFELPAETEQKLKDTLQNKKRENVILTLAKYYLANKPEDGDWVVLPVDNFNAYFGTTSFDRKWLPIFPEEIIVREDYAGICRFRLFL